MLFLVCVVLHCTATTHCFVGVCFELCCSCCDKTAGDLITDFMLIVEVLGLFFIAKTVAVFVKIVLNDVT